MDDFTSTYWRQPPRELIFIGSSKAYMSRTVFEKLPEYSGSIPSGVYPGKMWRATYYDDAGHVFGKGLKRDESKDVHFLRWFGIGPRANCCTNHQRQIVIV